LKAKWRLNGLCSLDAALAAGFGSYSQFYRTFTRLVGVGPRECICEGGRNIIALVPA
jgi:AraC-like DNA-binding protein